MSQKDREIALEISRLQAAIASAKTQYHKPQPPKQTFHPYKQKNTQFSTNASKNRSLRIVDGVSFTKNRKGNKLVNSTLLPPKNPDYNKEGGLVVDVGGVPFIVDKNKRKLIRKDALLFHKASTPTPTASSTTSFKQTPRKIRFNGQHYKRSKRGNLVLIKPKSLSTKTTKTPQSYCKSFTKFGVCSKKTYCKFTHDPKKIRLCSFLLSKTLSNPNHTLSKCKFSHTPSKQTVPICLNFTRGTCMDEACFLLHVKLNKLSKICRNFAIDGYCENGEDCLERHVFFCPDFCNDGECLKTNCKLYHPKKRAVVDDVKVGYGGNGKIVVGIDLVINDIDGKGKGKAVDIKMVDLDEAEDDDDGLQIFPDFNLESDDDDSESEDDDDDGEEELVIDDEEYFNPIDL